MLLIEVTKGQIPLTPQRSNRTVNEYFSSNIFGDLEEIYYLQQLGERIGKKREYISSLEQGQTDMQLSTFMLIANALGLRFSLVVG